MQEALSARQAEIAGMVARGRSSRDIAAALFLSRRTVENHIAAIFSKLGVVSRAELISTLWSSSTGGTENASATAAMIPKTNLPPQRTSLLARETEIAEIGLSVVDSRLVTVTGAGGVGKHEPQSRSATHSSTACGAACGSPNLHRSGRDRS